MLFPVWDALPCLPEVASFCIAGLVPLNSPAHSLAPSSRCSRNKLSMIQVLASHAELLVDYPSFLLETFFPEVFHELNLFWTSGDCTSVFLSTPKCTDFSHLSLVPWGNEFSFPNIC